MGLAALVAVLASVMLLGGCGDDDGAAGESSVAGVATGTATGAAAQPPFAAGSAMARVVAAGRLTVGVKFDQPGFGLRDASGKVDGFDVAIGKEIGRALGLREEQVTFVEAPSANRIALLSEGKVDLVIATMTITEARRQEIDFSRVYFRAGQSLLVRREQTTIGSVGDLNGRKACSVTGSTSATTVRERAPQVDLLALETYALCVAALKDGRVEAVTTDDVILAGFARGDASLKLVGGAFTQEPYGIGVKQGQADFVAFVDGVLNEMLRDGRWDRLYQQYLGGIEGLPSASEARAGLPAS